MVVPRSRTVATQHAVAASIILQYAVFGHVLWHRGDLVQAKKIASVTGLAVHSLDIYLYHDQNHGLAKLHLLSCTDKSTQHSRLKRMSGSNPPYSGAPRPRCFSTAGAPPTRSATPPPQSSTPAPRGRERLAINFLAGGGEQPYPHLAASSFQHPARQRTNSSHYPSQAPRGFVPTPSQFNPGQARVATGSRLSDPRGR